MGGKVPLVNRDVMLMSGASTRVEEKEMGERVVGRDYILLLTYPNVYFSRDQRSIKHGIS